MHVISCTSQEKKDQLNRNYYKKKLMIFSAENKMAEEEANVEYISLYGYIRNTPSDTEVHVEHQLTEGKSTWPVEKNI